MYLKQVTSLEVSEFSCHHRSLLEMLFTTKKGKEKQRGKERQEGREGRREEQKEGTKKGGKAEGGVMLERKINIFWRE